MLKVPSLGEISRRVVVRMRGNAIPLSDFSPASVLRILINAFAESVLELWYAVAAIRRSYYLDTATGPDLDRRMADFGIVRSIARPAGGLVRVERATIIIGTTPFIEAGTIVRTSREPLKRYKAARNPASSTGEWSLVAGPNDISVISVEVGAAGNVGAGEIDTFDSGLPNGINSVSNPSAIGNGKDTATDSEARDQLRSYLRSLTRGTIPSIRHAVLTFTDAGGAVPVHSVGIQEWNGTVRLEDPNTSRALSLIVYVDDGSGTAGGVLVGQLQALLEGDPEDQTTGYVAAGTPFLVLPATPRVVNVACQIEVSPRFPAGSVRQSVVDNIRAFFSALSVAEVRQFDGRLTGQVDFGLLAKAVTDTAGVERVTFAYPTGPTQVFPGEKAVAGTVEVTATV